jgi:hypothetical protein
MHHIEAHPTSVCSAHVDRRTRPCDSVYSTREQLERRGIEQRQGPSHVLGPAPRPAWASAENAGMCCGHVPLVCTGLGHLLILLAIAVAAAARTWWADRAKPCCITAGEDPREAVRRAIVVWASDHNPSQSDGGWEGQKDLGSRLIRPDDWLTATRGVLDGMVATIMSLDISNGHRLQEAWGCGAPPCSVHGSLNRGCPATDWSCESGHARCLRWIEIGLAAGGRRSWAGRCDRASRFFCRPFDGARGSRSVDRIVSPDEVRLGPMLVAYFGALFVAMCEMSSSDGYTIAPGSKNRGCQYATVDYLDD